MYHDDQYRRCSVSRELQVLNFAKLTSSVCACVCSWHFSVSFSSHCIKSVTNKLFGAFSWEFFSHTPDLNPEHSTNSFGHHLYPAPPLWFNLNDSAELCSFPGGLRWIGNLPLLCNYYPKRSFGPSWFISIYQRGAFRIETRTFQGSSIKSSK